MVADALDYGTKLEQLCIGKFIYHIGAIDVL